MFLMQAQFAWAIPTSECKTEKVTINGIESVKYDCNFKNPITSGSTIWTLIDSVVAQVRPFAITLVVFIIIYTGARYVIAVGSGNQGEVARWKKAILYAIIAGAIVGGALKLIEAIQNSADKIFK